MESSCRFSDSPRYRCGQRLPHASENESLEEAEPPIGSHPKDSPMQEQRATHPFRRGRWLCIRLSAWHPDSAGNTKRGSERRPPRYAGIVGGRDEENPWASKLSPDARITGILYTTFACPAGNPLHPPAHRSLCISSFP